jgi:hypothetical protein
LRLEELGARVLPSATPLAPAPPTNAALVYHTMPATHHPLAGHGHGNYSADAIQSGAGITYNLQGTANLADLGHVSIKGWVHSVGFIQNGHAGGQLTFSNGKGSVTVELTGPAQPAFSALPQKFDYRVVADTGTYAHLSDHGTLTLVLTAAPIRSGGGPQGSFTLTL